MNIEKYKLILNFKLILNCLNIYKYYFENISSTNFLILYLYNSKFKKNNVQHCSNSYYKKEYCY